MSEVAGAFGDIGTLIPLLVALAAMNGLPVGRALLGVGAIYVASGLYFRVPMPVLLLKAAAAEPIVVTEFQPEDGRERGEAKSAVSLHG